MTNWTKEREAEIQARCDAASRGPWGRDVWYVTAELKDGRPGGEVIIRCAASTYRHQDNERDIRNAEFCAHARTDLPDALDEIKRLRDQLISAWPHTAFTCPCSDRLAESAPLDKCDCGLTKALYAPEGGGA